MKKKIKDIKTLKRKIIKELKDLEKNEYSYFKTKREKEIAKETLKWILNLI